MFYTQVAEGKLKKFVLCEACAQEKGITSPDGLLMAEELLGGAPPPTQPIGVFPSVSVDSCRGCGFTLEDFRKVGRLGCPQCYEAFSREISQRLPSMHKATTHKGYIPEGLVKQQALRSQLTGLNADLEKAVSEERFEDAAALRDRINEIENKGEGVTSS